MAAWTAAAELPVLTLDDCLAAGRRESVRVANARRAEAEAEEAIREVRAQVLPSLRASGRYTRLDEEISFPGFDQPPGRADTYAASLDAEQLLYSGGSLRAALRAARSYRAAARAETARQDALLVRDITRGFHDVLYAQAAVEVAVASVRLLEDFETEARLKHQHQTLSEFEWLGARVRLANERPRLVAEVNRLRLAKAALRNLAGLDPEDFDLADDRSLPSVDASLDRLLEEGLARRPELRAADALMELRRADVRATQGRYQPQLRAFAAYQGNDPPLYEPGGDGWEWSWNAGLKVEWSLLDGGLRRAEVAGRKLLEARAAADRRQLERDIRLEIEAAYLDLGAAAEVAQGSRETVELAERALAIARVRFDQGLATALEVADSNLALGNARLIEHRARRDCLRAVADLRYACGSADRPAPAEEAR